MSCFEDMTYTTFKKPEMIRIYIANSNGRIGSECDIVLGIYNPEKYSELLEL